MGLQQKINCRHLSILTPLLWYSFNKKVAQNDDEKEKNLSQLDPENLIKTGKNHQRLTENKPFPECLERIHKERFLVKEDQT